jgi:two-component system, cell cycle sensor histidine kinase and response regulator CckA
MTSQPYACAKGRSAKDHSSRRRILLVEDEPFVREATCGILRQSGFEVLPAENAQDALKIFEECGDGIDLVMTDMILPGGTGHQLGRDLREHSPGIMVLVTSGYDMREYETEAPDSCAYFLAKPYSRQTLVDKIETILAQVRRLPATQAG